MEYIAPQVQIFLFEPQEHLANGDSAPDHDNGYVEWSNRDGRGREE